MNAEQSAVAQTLSKVNPEMKRPSKLIIQRLTEPARQAVEQKAAFRRAARKLAAAGSEPASPTSAQVSKELQTPKTSKSPTLKSQNSKESK